LEEVITEFYNKVRNPVLLNPTITVEPDVLSNVYPDPLPSIYIGNQMLIAGRYNDPGLITVILSGTAFGQQINYTYDYTLSDQINTDYSFLTKIWAKNMLENLILDYYLLNPNSSQAIQLRQEIINLSISWGVMCEFTHYTSIDEPIQDEDEFPETEEATLCVKLLGNFPNPFNPNTTIKFEVLKAINESAVVKIYNIKGELVKILIVDVRGAGIYEINWNGTDKQLKSVASGTYFYTISLDNSILAGKMVMLK
jgi:Ca-activated chloride channel family protein